LPPLNLALALDLITHTRVARLLDGYRDRPAADKEALALALTQVAQMMADLPEVMELDINPMLVDDRGVVALDARIRVAPATSRGVDRLAIRPYPIELEEPAQFAGRTILLRPIRPEEEPQHSRGIAAVDGHDLRVRFFHVVRSFEHSQLARLTQIDYDREMAFIAVARSAAGADETLGVVRAVADPEGLVAEFAALIRSDLKGQGLGSLLMNKLIRYCRGRGIAHLDGEVLVSNHRMLALVRSLGFAITSNADGDTVKVRLTLAAAPGETG
jgi:acetyltransferase